MQNKPGFWSGVVVTLFATALVWVFASAKADADALGNLSASDRYLLDNFGSNLRRCQPLDFVLVDGKPSMVRFMDSAEFQTAQLGPSVFLLDTKGRRTSVTDHGYTAERLARAKSVEFVQLDDLKYDATFKEFKRLTEEARAKGKAQAEQ